MAQGVMFVGVSSTLLKSGVCFFSRFVAFVFACRLN